MRTLVFAALLVLAQSSEGIIQVTVRDQDNRQLIPAVRVTVTLVRTQQTQPSTFTTASFTDTSGFTEFKNLSDGVYDVRIEREGYTTGLNSDRTSVFIREGSQRLNLELNLRRMVTITGRVLKSDGNPLAKAHVSPLLMTYRDGRRVLNRVGSVTATGRVNAEIYTNDKWEYSFEALPPGEYYPARGQCWIWG